MGLTFVPQDIEQFRLAVFVDTSFTSNTNFTSHLGLVTCLDAKYNKEDNVYYSSHKAKRGTRRALAAELFAVVHAFDSSSTLRATNSSMLETEMPMTVYTDSNSL